MDNVRMDLDKFGIKDRREIMENREDWKRAMKDVNPCVPELCFVT